MAYSFLIHAQRETGHRLHDAATDSFEALERMGGGALPTDLRFELARR
jgi:hypothetical protein